MPKPDPELNAIIVLQSDRYELPDTQIPALRVGWGLSSLRSQYTKPTEKSSEKKG